MAQRLLHLKKEAARNPLADRTPICLFIHQFLGGTHKPKEFEYYKDLCLKSSLKVEEEVEDDIQITAEIPVADDSLMTIRCRAEDLLEFHVNQNQLDIRTTFEQRVEATKDFFLQNINLVSKHPHKQT